jgi:hypothetical protein
MSLMIAASLSVSMSIGERMKISIFKNTLAVPLLGIDSLAAVSGFEVASARADQPPLYGFC